MYLYRHRVSFFEELIDDLETFPVLAFYCLPIFFSTFNHKLIYHAAFWFKKILHPNWYLPFGFIVGKWKQETLVVFCSHGDVVLSHCHTHKGACRGQGGHQPTRGCFEYLKQIKHNGTKSHDKMKVYNRRIKSVALWEKFRLISYRGAVSFIQKQCNLKPSKSCTSFVLISGYLFSI